MIICVRIMETTGDTMKHLFRLLFRLMAPLYFWIGYTAIRSGKFPITNGRNQWIMKMLRLAADFNHRRALSLYGHLLHLHGDTSQSKIQGGIYLQRAADMGDMKAQYFIGRLFENGFELYFSIDEDKAVSYYQLAAEQGHIIAINRLIDIYENGEMQIPQDPEKADYWRQHSSSSR